jgi:hypothetical protein
MKQIDFEYHSLGSPYSDTRLQDTSASPTKRLLHTTTAALDYKRTIITAVNFQTVPKSVGSIPAGLEERLATRGSVGRKRKREEKECILCHGGGTCR